MRTHKAMRFDAQKEREMEKAISDFSQPLMSNSKWIRLINKLVENADKILKIEFKKVQQDHIGELYLARDTEYGFDYWQNGFEGCNSLGGWLLFKEVEYLVFQKTVSNKYGEHYLEQIEALLESVGQFSIEKDENRLKLLCYKK